MSDRPETLADLLQMAETALTRGVADRRHPARHPVLATIGADGPEQRVLVLRGWSDAIARLQTDAATAKVRELTADPRCALHFWVPRQDLQIRLAGRATLTPGSAEDWERMPDHARHVYGGTPTPGTPMDGPDAFEPGAELARFTVLTVTCARMEVLHLGRDRHVRAVFQRANGAWDGQWIAP
ncbi:pyridoxamine 5'-phosphate oxidase family protein [Pseudaestuariivita atlantica]|uniref:Pyridoxamine 5'-phosphate oxidase Alr4036 family FMN-binding domain-containing protein n=1 Tax=Pseudaestuariivita atlantica TaxID=1317121 RepID=A0A0L1JK98_9RHOB|nr:pyridoxamine 5'-phosphate oxidase family protein [Pseudaestuariivita atlantica]KNG92171.1 hypothetical protein ATO11_18820 [Pseudaestuariivita atlantica]